MSEEVRPAPDWVGDVGLGVQAWVGETPPTPAESRGPRGRSVDGPEGGARGRRKKRSRRTWEEREAARVAREEAAAAEVEADPEAVARKILLDALTGQARSRKELADRLAKRGVPDELASGLLDRFTEVGLIDDASYARQWVESRHRSRGLAPRALAQELRRKGVGDEETKAALEQIDDGDQREAARALVEKKLRTMRGLDQQVATRRLAGLLARKGYTAGLAFSVVREALADAGSDDDVTDVIEPHDF
ncbi:regulatory protein RecX [Nocardioides hwasunensis]|uniref:Regulatory protein RecX n=1 Tax=Nocardioides hwasunensis TaxID=397258 RepID=A0ABR8MFJ4_9ACTN|nr:regulatory protein RecX [Nocardioides hwasunensis]MBD3914673.1 regulatory protein RecX [Nocardioides hwasunensis]